MAFIKALGTEDSIGKALRCFSALESVPSRSSNGTQIRPQISSCKNLTAMKLQNYCTITTCRLTAPHSLPCTSLLLRTAPYCSCRASHSSVQLCTAPYSFVQLRVSSICIDDHSNRLWLIKPESNHSRAALNLLLIKLRAKQVSIWWVSMTSRRVFVIPIRYTARREFAWC